MRYAHFVFSGYSSGSGFRRSFTGSRIACHCAAKVVGRPILVSRVGSVSGGDRFGKSRCRAPSLKDRVTSRCYYQ